VVEGIEEGKGERGDNRRDAGKEGGGEWKEVERGGDRGRWDRGRGG
jgi:hypothetical protein